jgi:uncharacterized membrane protein YidH (DUF202 family)
MSRSTQIVDDAKEMKTDSKRMRVLLILVGVGALATGIWKFVAGDLVTAGSLFVIMTLCVGRLRSEAVCRYMDNHPKTLLVGLIVVAIVAILSAMP